MEDHTTALQELTEKEFENLDIAHTTTTPLNSQSATAHHQTLEAKQLFGNNCHESVDAAMSQVPDERIANVIVQPTCDSALLEQLNESTSTEESMYKLQTKAAKLIEKITGYTKLLSEFDFLRATLKLKRLKTKNPLKNRKKNMLNS